MTSPPRSMEWVRERCREVDGCWEWSLHCKAGRTPLFSVREQQPDGSKVDRIYYVRHVVLWHKKGKRPSVSRKAVIAKCGNPKCVHPDHQQIITKGELGRLRSGFQKSLVQRKRVAEGRRKASKLSDADVAAIRSADVDPLMLANKYGVSRSYIHMLLKGQWRRDYTNPFSALGA